MKAGGGDDADIFRETGLMGQSEESFIGNQLRIFEIIEDHYYRVFTFCLSRIYDALNIHICMSCRISCYALMGPSGCKSVKDSFVDVLYLYPGSSCIFSNLKSRTLSIFLHQYLIYGPSRFDRL